MNVKDLIATNNLKPRDVTASIGVSVGAPEGSCLLAVDRDTRKPLEPIDDNATARLRAQGRMAINPLTGMEVCKVKESAPYLVRGVERKRGGHWRNFPGESMRKKAMGTNRRGVPGPLHEFMERALRSGLTHKGYALDPSRNPEYLVDQYSTLQRRGWSTARAQKKYCADVKATANNITLFFEVVDCSDYLDDDKKRKFIDRITGENTFAYRITSNRAKRLRSFDLLVDDKTTWAALVQDGLHEEAHYLLLNVGLKLLEEAQYANEIPTHAKTLREHDEHNNVRSTRLEIHLGGKAEAGPATNHTKRRKGVIGDKHGSAHERNDRFG